MADAAISLWQRLWYTRLRDLLRGRFDARLDWRRVLAEAALPDEIAEVVSNTVRATRLWNREKVDVARELVAHFQDGLERGREPHALVASFGDPRQTTALIRRAKKRGRPVAWRVWHYGWLSVAALFAVDLLTGLYMMSGQPSIKTDYLAIVNERATLVPESERAWPLYRHALLAMGAKITDDKTNPFVVACEASPGGEKWKQARQFLTIHQESLAELRKAAGRRELGLAVGPSWRWFAPEDRALLLNDTSEANLHEPTKREELEDRWLISTLIPHIQLLRSLGELFHNDCRRAVAEGDGEIALADLMVMLRISRQAEEPPFFMNLLAADAIQRQSYAAVRETLAGHPDLWSEAQLRGLAHRIAAARIDWRRDFQGEAACFYDVIQRMYTDNGQGDGRLAYRVSRDFNVFGMLDELTSQGAHPDSLWSHDALALLVLPAANTVVASRKEMTDAYHDYMQSAIVKIETPLWKQHNLPPENELLTDRAGMIDRYRYLFLRILAPTYNRLRNQRANVDGERDGVLIGIALELFHREHGEWPNSLDELSPRWLPEVPVDRITGEPLHYKIVDGRPVVYSVGVDGDDDGGKIPRGGNGAELASAIQFRLEPQTDATHDGDWVIWSTAPAGAISPVPE
jgi:hypothetical protein